MKIHKLLLLLLPLLVALSPIWAQTKIGGNLSSTNPGAALEIGSVNQGLLMARVSLTTTTMWAPLIGTAAAGMMVFNTNTTLTAGSSAYPVLSGGVGIYFWDGIGWIGVSTDAISPFWKITGNAGTTAGTNFLGTTDNINLVFKRNSVQAGLLDASNTAFGVGALSAVTTGANNTALGVNALSTNTIGGNNIAVGYNQNAVSATASNQLNIGGAIFGTGLTGTASAPAGNIGINTTTPGNSLEVNSGIAGSSGVRLTQVQNSTTGASANSVNGKYLSVDASGNLVLANASDPTVEVSGLAASLTSPNSFSGGAFLPNTPANINYVYINDTDGSLWTYNAGSGLYQSYTTTPSTEWYLSSGTTDAGSNKTAAIYRAGRVGINTTVPGTNLEVNSGTAGLSGMRFTQVLNSSTATSASSVNGKYLSVDANGNIVLANASDPTVDVTGLAAGLTSPNSFSGGTFTPATPANPNNVYINDIDGTLWTYNTSTGLYASYTAPASTEWYLSSGTTDANSNKTAAVYRTGNVGIGTTTPNRALEVSAVAGTPPIRTTNMNSSSASMTGTLKSVVVNSSGDFGVSNSVNSIAKIVNSSVPVTLDSLQVEVSGNGSGFMLASTAGTLSVVVAGWTNYSFKSTSNMAWFSSGTTGVSLTTTFACPFAWSGNIDGGNAIKVFVTDLTHKHGYEITIVMGPPVSLVGTNPNVFNNNLVEIRRML